MTRLPGTRTGAHVRCYVLACLTRNAVMPAALFHGDDADAMVSYMAKHPVEKRRELSALSKDARSFILRCLVWEEDGRPTGESAAGWSSALKRADSWGAPRTRGAVTSRWHEQMARQPPPGGGAGCSMEPCRGWHAREGVT